MGRIVYMLRCGRKTYIGATVDLKRRLRQHRGELQGGARYTRTWKDVVLVGTVSGFSTWSSALSYEWHAKRRSGPMARTVPRSAPARAYRFAGTMKHPKFMCLPLDLEWHVV